MEMRCVCGREEVTSSWLSFLKDEADWWHHLLICREVTEGEIDAILNPVASAIPKWRTSKLLRWMWRLNQATWDHCSLQADISSKDGQVLIRLFLCRKQKYKRRGRLKVKIHVYFYGDNKWTVKLIQMKFGTIKHHGHAYQFHLIHYFI
jgi:hypothetical protein